MSARLAHHIYPESDGFENVQVSIEVVNTELDSERGGRVIDSIGWEAIYLGACLLLAFLVAKGAGPRARGAMRL